MKLFFVIGEGEDRVRENGRFRPAAAPENSSAEGSGARAA